jgi:hypothetical protein
VRIAATARWPPRIHRSLSALSALSALRRCVVGLGAALPARQVLGNLGWPKICTLAHTFQ